MILRAGSAPWLLRHELRLLFFKANVKAKKGVAARGVGKAGIALWVSASVVLHGVAFALLGALGGAKATSAHALVMGLTGLYAAVVSIMLSSAMKLSVEVLFERADLDLLLSSPLSTRSIFTVRLLGIVIAIASIYLFFLAPLAHAGLVLGQVRWLAIYPVVLGTAMLAASLAMLLTLLLVRLFGVRRTRVLAQLLGALSGALVFLLSQVYANTLDSFRVQVSAWYAPLLAPGAAFGPDSAVWLPGHALLGAPRPLLALGVTALLVFVLSVRLTHRFFAHGLQQAAGMVRVAKAPHGGQRYRFARSLTQAIIIKEWRLIARDPHLLSQVLLQLLYLLPLCLLLLFKSGAQMAGIGAALTFLCGSLTAALAWVIIAAEEAPDLLRAAPCAMRAIQRAKLAAVAMPALAIVSAPLLWVLLRDPLAALLTCATVVACVASSALIALWCARPAVRGDFKRRGKGNVFISTLETVNGVIWSGLAYMLLSMHLARSASPLTVLAAAALCVSAFAVLALGWCCRHRAAQPSAHART
ncbi:MAG: hypothetical protein H7335_23360 [Massilia sp.]|nr:hypothetical protein [Massilia sp.]